MGAALVAEVVQHQRRIRGHLADLFALVVQHTQRIELCAGLRVLVQIELEQELLQLLAVRRAAVLVAQASQLETETGEPAQIEVEWLRPGTLGYRVMVADSSVSLSRTLEA